MMGTRQWDAAEDRWPGRGRLVASMIPPGSAVLDLGAGAEGLRDRLPAGCRYVPLDRVRRSASTIVADLDDRDLSLPAGFDVIAAVGVLEYLDDLDHFFRITRPAGEVMLLTYTRHRVKDPASEWRRRLTVIEFKRAAYRARWRRRELVGRVEGQLIWRLT